MATISTAKLNLYLTKYKELICASDSNRIPRFGPYSIHAKGTPMFVFESPELAEEINATAFTDGTNIYFFADFFEKLLRSQKEHSSNDVEFVIMHELAHMLYQHTKRMKEFPHDVANIAQDLSINTRLQRDFEQLKVSPFLNKMLYGFKPGDIEHYSTMFEEDIARELLTKDAEKLKELIDEINREIDEDDKNQSNQSQSSKNGKKQKGNSGDQGDEQDEGQGEGQDEGQAEGEGQDQGEGEDAQGNGKGKGQKGKSGKNKPGKGQPGDQGDEQDDDQGDENGNDGQQNGKKGGPKKGKGKGKSYDHIVDPRKIRDVLEKAGMGHIADTMNLPKSKADVEKFMDKQKHKVMDTIHQSKQENMRANGRLPGQHSLDFATEIVKDLSAPKMKWKGAISELVYGSGMNYKYTDDVPGSIYHYDPAIMGFDHPVYVGETIPAKSDTTTLVFVDTSGSVSDPELKEFYSETIGMLDNDDMAGEIIIMSADSAMRGEPLIINTDTYEVFKKGVPFHGRGGTDFLNSIRGGMEWADKNEKKVQAIVYFTDLGDNPPNRDQLPDNLPRMLYVTTKATYTEAFRRQVEHYADTVAIEVDKEIDLDELHDNRQSAGMGM